MSLQAYLRRSWRRLPFTDKEPLDVRINQKLDNLNREIDVLKAELELIKRDYEAIDGESLSETDQKRRLAHHEFSVKKHKGEKVLLHLVTLSYVKNFKFNVSSMYQNSSVSMSSLICKDDTVHEETIEKVRGELDISHLRDILTLTLPGELAINKNQFLGPWESESCSYGYSSLQPELPAQEMTQLLIAVLGEGVSSHLYYNRSSLETAPDTNAHFPDIAEYETSD